MTDAGFTKGPWYVGGNSRDILWFDHALDRCKLVATVAGYVESEGTVPHGLGTARLIAAAPDLFEALRQAAEHFEDIERKAMHWMRTFANSPNTEARWSQIKSHAGHRAREARAALLKASGEPQ